jgi:hypothetical protein
LSVAKLERYINWIRNKIKCEALTTVILLVILKLNRCVKMPCHPGLVTLAEKLKSSRVSSVFAASLTEAIAIHFANSAHQQLHDIRDRGKSRGLFKGIEGITRGWSEVDTDDISGLRVARRQ